MASALGNLSPVVPAIVCVSREFLPHGMLDVVGWPLSPHEVPQPPPSRECPAMLATDRPGVPNEMLSPTSAADWGRPAGPTLRHAVTAVTNTDGSMSMSGSPQGMGRVRSDGSHYEMHHATRSRHSGGSCGTSESWRDRGQPYWSSWHISNHEELINNEFVAALHDRSVHGVLSMDSSGIMLARKHAVDWDRQSNRDKLKDLCHLIRSLFWAFTDEDAALQIAELSWRTSSCSSIASHGNLYRQVKETAALIVRHEAFSLFFVVLTVYALFGPDALLALGHSAQNKEDLTLAVFNSVVLFFFVLEEVLNCWVTPGYVLSGRFWVDTFATLSIIGDTWFGLWIGEIIESDAAVAGRGSRLVKLVRLGGRSSRLVRIFRVTRLIQVVKLIPMIQEWIEKDTKQLANLLWRKRLWHVLRVLDRDGTRRLDAEQMEFFDVAMFCEFGALENGGVRHSVTHAVTEMGGRMGDKIIHTAHLILGEERGFGSIADSFKRTLIGRRSFQRCVDDVLSMKESCVLVERAISGLVLKCCLLVLALLIMTQLFASTEEELALNLGLNQLDLAARSLPAASSAFCRSMVDEYSTVSSHSMLLLILDNRVWWNETCRCCGADLAADGLLVLEPTSDSGVVDGVVRATGLESHELKLEEVIADGNHRSVSVFDLHQKSRSDAVASMMGTLAVVVILLGLVFFFASDMKRLSSSNVLYPMWDLMDDMCALKSLEVLGRSSKEGADDGSQGLAIAARPARSARRGGCNLRFRRPIPVAEELVRLRESFAQLHTAMLSWSKFVPVALLKQLFRAKVEAQIGASHCDLTILFCDVRGFKELCEDMSPQEVLSFLECVLARIYRALDENGGTMLEFIGDEVLAVFNAPMPVVGHPLHALAAAVEAQRLVADEPIPALKGQSARLACSVHRAQVLAGNLGSPTRMKYGVLGDGVNLCARLKSLNTRFGTGMLVSEEVLEFPGARGRFVTRPVGKLILKGRTTPTFTHEVLGNYLDVAEHVVEGAEAHQRGFDLFCSKSFTEAKKLLQEAHKLLSRGVTDREPGNDMGDQPTLHLIRLCEKYLVEPPPDEWDGSEHLTKKSW